MKAAILISTRNRASDLRETLIALERVIVPDGLDCEVVVIDSASTDQTYEVTHTARFSRLKVCYLREDQPGKSRALNRALAQSPADVLLFTDDDVRFPADWIVEMSATVLNRKAIAVAGGVRFAPHLLRSWQTRFHRAWLASTEWLQPEEPRSLVGANMALSRALLERVPGFDPELGPGALGFGDDALLARQIFKAGYRITGRLDVCVEHHFDAARMTRRAWLDAAERHGRTEAYLTYHWDHRDFRFARLRLWVAKSKLAAWRRAHPNPPAEGCDEHELRLVARAFRLRAYLSERLRRRNYEPQGLCRRSGHPESRSVATQQSTKRDLMAPTVPTRSGAIE